MARSKPRVRSERLTYGHLLPNGLEIDATLLVIPVSEWELRPESRSPLWAFHVVGGTVYALAIGVDRELLAHWKNLFDPSRN
jgi:hypothetical protein